MIFGIMSNTHIPATTETCVALMLMMIKWCDLKHSLMKVVAWTCYMHVSVQLSNCSQQGQVLYFWHLELNLIRSYCPERFTNLTYAQLIRQPSHGSFSRSVLCCVLSLLQEFDCLPISPVSCWHVTQCPLSEGELVGCENASVGKHLVQWGVENTPKPELHFTFIGIRAPLT